MIYAKLNYIKNATARPGDRLNGLENSKTQIFNTLGVWKLPYLKSVPLSPI